jgi:hypothetical protein
MQFVPYLAQTDNFRAKFGAGTKKPGFLVAVVPLNKIILNKYPVYAL